MFFVFSRFLPPKKQKTEPHGLRGAKESHRAIVSRVLCFFVFSRFWPLLAKNQKKTSRKQKKHRQCGAKGYSHRATVSRALFFCFCHYWPKTSKIREKKPPPQKNSTDYVGPRCSHRAIASRIVFFKVFSRFLQLVVKNKESTNPKTKLHRLCGANG